ncbi:glycosyltransferase [Lewinella sp. IMCC34183]|uniref:glycosyltransferase n=1 Tax=Lewinella sp. IMCC34183 TaxID=2248762 RepID=UPI00130037FE|nr:glycosyltransferase [Lewinella sp. IMCC34183]
MGRTLSIIVTYQAEAWLSTCLESIRALGELIDTVVVDNASTDGTRSLLSGQYRDLIDYYHPLRRNVGFGRAHNFVFAQPYARNYDHFLLLNQDAALPRPAFERLLQQADAEPGFGILSPVHYRSATERDSRFASYLRPGDPVVNGIREVPFVNAAIWLLRREVIDRIGGFNPVFPHYGEDENFATRLGLAGYRLGVVEDSTGYHYRPAGPVVQRTQLSPYAFWIVGLLRTVNPKNHLLRAVVTTGWDYLTLIARLTTSGRVGEAKRHLPFLLRYIRELPRYVRYHQLIIRETGLEAADEP